MFLYRRYVSRRDSTGFSLVELSIVLVILGLLTGGILAGQSLIRASELRAVSTEYSRYVAAMYGFRDRYFGWPGDITNATSIWGAAATCPGDSTHIGTGTQTCNGDGDGNIAYNNANSNEPLRFWQQLANAGLIEGSYNGVEMGTNAWGSTPGTNSPKSKLGGAGWSLLDWNSLGTCCTPITVASTQLFEGLYHNVLMFGASTANGTTDTAILKPEEAWNLDTKLDDGRPGLGKLRVYESATSCQDAGTSATVALAPTANYLLSNSSIACNLIFNTMP